MSYISKIEIDSLWSGLHHVQWTLRNDVNILSGVNGVGKSTILSRVVKHLTDVDRLAKINDGVTLTFEPPESNGVQSSRAT